MSHEKSSVPTVDSGPNQPKYSMDRIRLESIEKRRQDCSNIIKDRKRKLSELYCVSRLPLLPISNDQVLQIEDKLMAFLEKNDLENGHEFNISILTHEKQQHRRPSPPRQQSQQGSSQPQQKQQVQPNNTPTPPSMSTSTTSTPNAIQRQPPAQVRPPSDSQTSSQVPVQTASIHAKRNEVQPTSSRLPDEQATAVEGPPRKIQKVSNDKDSEQVPEPNIVPRITTTNEDNVKQLPESSTVTITAATVLPGTVQQKDQPQISQLQPPQTQQSQRQQPQRPQTMSPIMTKRHVETIPNEPPTLSSLIHSYSEPPQPRRAEDKSKRDLDYENIDINKLMVMLMPESKPHKVPEARSLTELYYHQQTLQLPKLLLRAHKSLTTDAYETALVEGKVSVLYSRMEELKRKHSWSLRQPRKQTDPFLASGKKSHWDYLLSEMKWLSTDYKQERKYKAVQSYYISQAVMDYWTYGKVCCVNRKAIKFLDDKEEEEKEGLDQDQEKEKENEDEDENENDQNKITDVAGTESNILEELTTITDEKEVENEEDKENEEDRENVEVIKVREGNHEAEEDVKMEDAEAEVENDKSEEEEKEKDTIDISLLLQRPDPSTEIPAHKLPKLTLEECESIKKDSNSVRPFRLFADLHQFNKTELTIITNLPAFIPFSEKEKDHIVEKYQYGHISAMLPPFDEEAEWEKILFKKQKELDKHSVPYQKGLFASNYRRFNILKPPTPPTIKNLELRIPTIWLPQDDKYLIRYVTDFSFNWNIISAHLSPHPTHSYTSNIERRTPWQCFERYIQLNDKFQFSDMRGIYAVAAKEWLEAAHKAQTTTKRRVSPLGVGIESIQRGHRRLRWGSMFDAVRKLMKKRESVQKPSQQARKTNSDDKRIDTPTPEQLSKLKFERDKAIQEAYAQNTNGANYGRMRMPANYRPPVPSDQIEAAAAHQRRAQQGNTGPIPAQSGQRPVSNGLRQQQQQAGVAQNHMPMAAQGTGTGLVSAPVGANNVRVPNGLPQQQLGVPSQQGQQGQQQVPLVTNPTYAQGAGVSQQQAHPSTPNGTPYTPEQIQQLMHLQRQKQLIQKQQQQQQQQAQASRIGAANSAAASPVSTPTPQQVLLSANNSNISSSPQGYGHVPIQRVSSQHQLMEQQQQLQRNASSPTTQKQQRLANQQGIASSPPSSQGISPQPIQAQMQPQTPQPGQQQQQSQGQGQSRTVPRVNFTTSQVSAIINQIQTQNPNLPKEQVTRLAVAYLANYQQTQNRNAAAQAAAQVAHQSPTPPGQAQSSQTQPRSMSQQNAQTGPANTNATSTPSSSSSTSSQPTQPQDPQQLGQNGAIAGQLDTPPPKHGQAQQQLTPQQLAAYANNPNLTPQQRKQIQVLRSQQLQQQQRRQQFLQQQQQLIDSVPQTPQPQSIPPQTPQQLVNSLTPQQQQALKSLTVQQQQQALKNLATQQQHQAQQIAQQQMLQQKKVGNASITTRFSPQPGSGVVSSSNVTNNNTISGGSLPNGSNNNHQRSGPSSTNNSVSSSPVVNDNAMLSSQQSSSSLQK